VPTLKPNQDVGVEPTGHTTKWDQTVVEKGVIVAVVKEWEGMGSNLEL
jgi:hypothetical protein